MLGDMPYLAALWKDWSEDADRYDLVGEHTLHGSVAEELGSPCSSG